MKLNREFGPDGLSPKQAEFPLFPAAMEKLEAVDEVALSKPGWCHVRTAPAQEEWKFGSVRFVCVLMAGVEQPPIIYARMYGLN